MNLAEIMRIGWGQEEVISKNKGPALVRSFFYMMASLSAEYQSQRGVIYQITQIICKTLIRNTAVV